MDLVFPKNMGFKVKLEIQNLLNGLGGEKKTKHIVVQPPHLTSVTLPKTNIAPENGWLEDYFPFGARPIFRAKS